MYYISKLCIVLCDVAQLLTTTEIWGEEEEASSEAEATASNGDWLELIFPAQQAGQYQFQLLYRGRQVVHSTVLHSAVQCYVEVRGSPWQREVNPGPPEPAHCRLVGLPAYSVVLRAGSSTAARLELRDRY